MHTICHLIKIGLAPVLSHSSHIADIFLSFHFIMAPAERYGKKVLIHSSDEFSFQTNIFTCLCVYKYTGYNQPAIDSDGVARQKKEKNKTRNARVRTGFSIILFSWLQCWWHYGWFSMKRKTIAKHFKVSFSLRSILSSVFSPHFRFFFGCSVVFLFVFWQYNNSLNLNSWWFKILGILSLTVIQHYHIEY